MPIGKEIKGNSEKEKKARAISKFSFE